MHTVTCTTLIYTVKVLAPTMQIKEHNCTAMAKTKLPMVGALGGSSYPIPQKKSLSKVLFQLFKKGNNATGDQMSEKEFIM